LQTNVQTGKRRRWEH